MCCFFSYLLSICRALPRHSSWEFPPANAPLPGGAPEMDWLQAWPGIGSLAAPKADSGTVRPLVRTPRACRGGCVSAEASTGVDPWRRRSPIPAETWRCFSWPRDSPAASLETATSSRSWPTFSWIFCVLRASLFCPVAFAASGNVPDTCHRSSTRCFPLKYIYKLDTGHRNNATTNTFTYASVSAVAGPADAEVASGVVAFSAGRLAATWVAAFHVECNWLREGAAAQLAHRLPLRQSGQTSWNNSILPIRKI